jgi:adenosylmethionine-8-amino-7-oxononanoate aminotransferase
LSTISKSSKIKKIRVLGSIAAFDLDNDRFKYGSKSLESLKKEFLNRGLLLRPIGKTIYLMPPFCIKKKALEDCYKIIEEVIN